MGVLKARKPLTRVFFGIIKEKEMYTVVLCATRNIVRVFFFARSIAIRCRRAVFMVIEH